jgi:hypothetical protein
MPGILSGVVYEGTAKIHHENTAVKTMAVITVMMVVLLIGVIFNYLLSSAI